MMLTAAATPPPFHLCVFERAICEDARTRAVSDEERDLVCAIE